MALDDRFQTLPFAQAVSFLEDKITLDTDGWRDISDDEQDAFFVVAGAKGNILADLRESVQRAIREGRTLAEFTADFEQISEDWAHRGDKDWRARIIYQTNMRMAHAAGRNQQQLDPDVIRVQPYRQAVHGDSNQPRPKHLALDGLVFRAGEEPIQFPNGFGCSCRYISLTQRQLEQRGLSVSTLERGDTATVEIDGQTYNPVLEPDEGFDYTPGMSSAERREEIIQSVLARSTPAVREQIQQDLNRETDTDTQATDLLQPFPSLYRRRDPTLETLIETKVQGNSLVIESRLVGSESLETIEGLPELDVFIRVNESYRTGTVPDSLGPRVALTLLRRMREWVKTLPDGLIIYCTPYQSDGMGDSRASLYTAFGFSPPNSENEQFAIVEGGKLRQITVEQIIELDQK